MPATGNGLTDADRLAIARTAKEADHLIGDEAVKNRLLTLFTERAKRHGLEVPEAKLPDLLQQLAGEHAHNGLYVNTGGSNEKRIGDTVRHGAFAKPITTRAESSHEPFTFKNDAGSKKASIPSAAVPPQAAIPLEEVQSYMGDMRRKFAELHRSRLILSTKTTATTVQTVRQAPPSEFREATRTHMLATFGAMARQGGETKVPPEYLPQILLILEDEIKKNQPFVESHALIPYTIRSGAVSEKKTANAKTADAGWSDRISPNSTPGQGR